MELTDEDTKANFLGATNMEKEIYDLDSRFFAPYYRQAGLNVYAMETSDREQYLELAFDDVKNAFEYYYENCNDGRPIILAGFSQGADMCIRLMKECFRDENRQNQLIACYAIGWSITEEETSSLTGAYIDDVRGTLKVTDVTPGEYPAGLDIFEDGIYHLYDYQFFYRNLQKNVQTRIDAWQANK